MRNKTMKRRINEEISYGLDNDELEKELDDIETSDARSEHKSTRISKLKSLKQKRQQAALSDRDIAVKKFKTAIKKAGYGDEDKICEFFEIVEDFYNEFADDKEMEKQFWKRIPYASNCRVKSVYVYGKPETMVSIQICYKNGNVFWEGDIPGYWPPKGLDNIIGHFSNEELIEIASKIENETPRNNWSRMIACAENAITELAG